MSIDARITANVVAATNDVETGHSLLTRRRCSIANTVMVTTYGANKAIWNMGRMTKATTKRYVVAMVGTKASRQGKIQEANRPGAGFCEVGSAMIRFLHVQAGERSPPLPNGLELSRLASPRLVSRQRQTTGWPGRLSKTVRPGCSNRDPAFSAGHRVIRRADVESASHSGAGPGR